MFFESLIVKCSQFLRKNGASEMQEYNPYDDKDTLEHLALRTMSSDMEHGWKFYNAKGVLYTKDEDLEVPFMFAKKNNFGYRTYSFLHYILQDEHLSQHLKYFIKHFDIPLNQECDDQFAYIRKRQNVITIIHGTPLQTAIRFAKINEVRTLLSTKGVDISVNAQTLTDRFISSNNNILHLAVHTALVIENPRGDDLVSLLLLEFGLTELVNQKNQEGYTPFHLVLSLHAKNPLLADRLINQMLTCGADLSLRDGDNKTILDYDCIKNRNTFLTQYVFDSVIKRFLSPDMRSIQNLAQIYYENRLDSASHSIRERVQSLMGKPSRSIRPVAKQADEIQFVFKSRKISFNQEIPQTLARTATTYKYNLSSHNGNYILVAITVLYSAGPYPNRHDSSIQKTTFLLGSDQSHIKCECHDDEFLNSIADRLLKINAKTSEEFLKLLNHRNTLTYNDYTASYEASSFHRKFMHSEATMLSHIESEGFINELTQTFNSHNVTFGSKIRGILLDVVSTKELCTNACDDQLVALQNSRNRPNGFLNRFEQYAIPKDKDFTEGQKKFYTKKDFALQVRFTYFNPRKDRYPLTEHAGPVLVDPRQQSINSTIVLNPHATNNDTPHTMMIPFGRYCPTVFRSGSKTETTDAVTFVELEARESTTKKAKVEQEDTSNIKL